MANFDNTVRQSSHYVSLQGREVHYTQWDYIGTTPVAAPEGISHIIMWHGLARHGRDFDFIAPRIAAKFGIPVVCPDTIGRALSEWSTNPKDEYKLAFYHKQVGDLFTALGVTSCYWVGTSMGGLIGMNAAAHYAGKIKKLILNDIGPEVNDDAIQRIIKYTAVPPKFRTLTELEKLLRAAYATIGPAEDSWWHHLAETSCRRLPDGQLTTHYDPEIIAMLTTDTAENAEKDSSTLWPTWKAYESIVDCEVLTIRGAVSDLLAKETLQKMSEVGPKSKIVELEGLGHAPSFNTQEQVDLVSSFLA